MSEKKLQPIAVQHKVTKFLKAQGIHMAQISILALTAVGMEPEEIRALGIPEKASESVIKQAMSENGFKTKQELVDFLITESEAFYQMNLGTRHD